MQKQYDDKTFRRKDTVDPITGLPLNEFHDIHKQAELHFKSVFSRKRFRNEDIFTRKPGNKKWSVTPYRRSGLDFRLKHECEQLIIFFDQKFIGWQFWSKVREWDSEPYGQNGCELLEQSVINPISDYPNSTQI